MKLLQRHIEFCVAAASLILIWLAAVGFTPAGADRWRTATIAALACGLLSAATIWSVRGRRQAARQIHLLEAQNHLHEIIVHERAVGALAEQIPSTHRPVVRAACLAIARAVTATSDTLQAVAEDRLATRSRPDPAEHPMSGH